MKINLKKTIEFLLYTFIIGSIFFILANYKFQPSLSAEEYESINEVNKIIDIQKDFVDKTDNNITKIDFSKYNLETGYSDLLFFMQALLALDVISGYPNDETEAAFLDIQKTYQLKETGELDSDTFMHIMETRLPLSLADLQRHPYLVQIIQRELGLPEDGYFDENMIKEIEKLKEDLNIEGSNLIDDKLVTYFVKQFES